MGSHELDNWVILLLLYLPMKSSFMSMSLSNTSTWSSWPGSWVRITWRVNQITNVTGSQKEILIYQYGQTLSTFIYLQWFASTQNEFYLIHLIPRGVKISLDNLTRKCFAPNVDLYIGVTFAFHHAPHQVIFGNKILACQQMDPEQTLEKTIYALWKVCLIYMGKTKSKPQLHFITSVAKLGWGEECWGSCLDSPASRLEATSDGIRSSSNHKTCDMKKRKRQEQK